MTQYKLLLVCLFLAIVLRFWALDIMPPHLRNDEAGIGYNAYSILKTGKDEHGFTFPLLFKSFGDYKPGLYVYLTVPFIATLGLNEWAVRLPAAVSGIIAVYLFYYLTFYLFKNQRVALIAAFLLSTSPWHVAFSRGAWEAQVTVTLTIAGLTFFLKGLERNKGLIILSAFFLGLTFLMSHSAKPATSLVILALLISYRNQIIKIPFKVIFISCLIFLILTLPIVASFFNSKSSHITSLFVFNSYKGQSIGVSVNSFLKDWVDHYSLSSLFIKGDNNPQHTAADFGPFLPIDLLFLFLGIKTFINRNYFKKKEGIFILSLLILTPLSSVLAEGGVNFVRYLNFFLPLLIIMSLGLSGISKNWLKVVTLLYFFFMLIFLDAYFIHTPAKSGAWQYGYKDIVKIVTPIQSKYENVYIPQGSDQPYIFFLFYQKYPPEKFQKEIALTFTPNVYSGMGSISKLDNIEFVDLRKITLPKNKTSLLVVPESDALYNPSFKNLEEIGRIKDPIGLPLYKILQFTP